MDIITNKLDLKKYTAGQKNLGLVPTMGALHAGHISLVDMAHKNADKVIVSIFVNPKQFAAGEDFDKYPRSTSEDIKKLQAGKNVDAVYIPSIDDMYDKHQIINMSVGEVGTKFEGHIRPGFFNGVALVVTKLFMRINPNIAVFGEKDFQQLYIIKRLVSELDMNVKIISAPIIRGKDDLALSSRNLYLTEKQRQIAPALYHNLNIMRTQILKEKSNQTDKIIESGKNAIVASGFDKIDYINLISEENFEITDTLTNSRLIAAARIGNIRLIDNLKI